MQSGPSGGTYREVRRAALIAEALTLGMDISESCMPKKCKWALSGSMQDGFRTLLNVEL
jgi:hypothetical protein